MTNFRTAQAALRNTCPGLTVRIEPCGEYRVTFTLSAIQSAYPELSRNEAIAKAESLAAYADSIDDMVDTAHAMHRTGLIRASDPASALEPAPAKVETINIAMGWNDCLGMLLTLYSDGNAKGRKYALGELRRMATLADSVSGSK